MWRRIARPQCAEALQDLRYYSEAFPPDSMGGDAFYPEEDALRVVNLPSAWTFAAVFLRI